MVDGRWSTADGRGLTSMADGRGRTSMAKCRAGTGRTGSFSDFVLGNFRMSFTVGNAVLALLLTAVGSTVFLISRNFLSRARGSGSGDFLSSFNIGVSIVRMLKVSNMYRYVALHLNNS